MKEENSKESTNTKLEVTKETGRYITPPRKKKKKKKTMPNILTRIPLDYVSGPTDCVKDLVIWTAKDLYKIRGYDPLWLTIAAAK